MKENIPYITLDKNYDVVGCHNNADKLYGILLIPGFFGDLFGNRKFEDISLPAVKNISLAGLFNAKLLIVGENDYLNCYIIDDGRNLPGYATMSAQLREPVSGIFSLLPVVVDSINKDNPDKAVMFLEEIYRSSYKLLRSITNIGIMDKIANDDAGKISVINFSSLLGSIADSVKNAVRNINITCEIEDNILINANVSNLSVAVLNLISNSIMYKQDDDTAIVMRLEKHRDTAVFTYTDNSKGIKEENIQDIFKPYYSQDPYSDGGTSHRLGLGLTIAKEAFRRAGGNLLLTSRFGKGVRYSVAVPCAAASEFMFESRPSDYLLNRYSDVFVQLCECCILPSIE